MTARRLIDAWFENVWNKGNADWIEAGFAADGVMTGLAADTIRGPADFRAFHADLSAAFDEIETQVGDFVEAAARFGGYAHVKARHRASGRHVAFDTFFVGETKGGKIWRAHNCTDFLGMMVQAGALPADAFDSALSGKPVFDPLDYRDQ